MTFKRIYVVVIETGLSACSQFRRNFISEAFDTEEIISVYDPISNFLPILQLISFQPAKEQYIIISWSYMCISLLLVDLLLHVLLISNWSTIN